jgi:hypothetical protein
MILDMRATQSFIPAFGVRLQSIDSYLLNFRFFDLDLLSDCYQFLVKLTLLYLIDLPIYQHLFLPKVLNHLMI